MFDQKTLLDLYKRHQIGAKYGVTFPEFVNDFGTLDTAKKSPSDLDVIVRDLTAIYEAKKSTGA